MTVLNLWGKVNHGLRQKSYTDGAGARARLRALWHLLVRRYDGELCDHCGRPVGLVWWCHDDRLWEKVTGRKKPPGKEPAGGSWCIPCFDKAAAEHGGWIEWAPLNLRHLREGEG